MKEFQNYSDNELDDLFREAHNATELSSDFQPSFWEEMEALLPEKKQKRRAGIFWWTAAALLVLGVTLFVVNDEEKSTMQPKAIAGNNDNNKHINTLKNTSENAQQSSVSYKDTQPTTKSTNESNDRLVQQQLQLNESVVAQVDNHLTVVLPEDNNQSTIESSTNVVEAPSKLAVITPKMNVQQLLPLQKYSDEQLFYVQVGTGIGRSYQNQVNGKNNTVYQVSLGAGLNKQINGMQLTAGIQLRTEFLSNIQWIEPVSATSYQLGQARQIYSIDFPLSIGAVLSNNNVLSFNITPGIQSFYVGSSSLIANDLIVAREQKVETLQHTKSLTMEMGLSYSYAIRRSLLLGGQVNVDMISPFNTNYYAGKQSAYPLNGLIYIRKLF
jgi:hypothetical protein